jgi:hypothetical protein
MNYLKVYKDLCKSRKQLIRSKGGSVYYENHHYNPRCMGGDDSDSNMVLLTAKEHFIAHYLLYRVAMTTEVPGKVKSDLTFAFIGMKGNDRKYHNSILYEAARVEFSNLQKVNMLGEGNPRYGVVGMCGKDNPNFGKGLFGEDNGMHGKTHTPEAKLKIAEAEIGFKHSEESKRKMSESVLGEKNHFYGKHHTEETKKKHKEFMLNQTKIKCPWCAKLYSPPMAKRWHFDNCKLKSAEA